MAVDSTARLLALLSMLSSRASWSGVELAERLQVTDRTVRRDVDRLRSLDYPVDSTSGTSGGYRLRAGSAVPPLFFDDDEAVAIVAALLVAIGNQSTGMVDGSTRALGKLHHLLPSRLLHTVAAIQESAAAVPFHPAPQIDPRRIALLAESCRNGIQVRFGYRTRADAASERRVEPHRILTARSVWYLIGFDLDRDDWRLFRIDRMHQPVATGHGIASREIPGGDPMTFLGRSLAATPYPHTADVEVAGTAERLLADAPWVNPARIDAGPSSCVVHLGSDVVGDLVGEIVRLIGAADVVAVAATAAVEAHLDLVRDRLRAGR